MDWGSGNAPESHRCRVHTDQCLSGLAPRDVVEETCLRPAQVRAGLGGSIGCRDILPALRVR